VTAIKLAEGDVDAIHAFRAYQTMHGEGLVPGAFDALKTLTNVLRMVRGPGSAVLLAMDGEACAGVLSLWEDGYWWNHERHLIDKGLYVYPAYRDGEAFGLLLNAAKQASDDAGLPLYITIRNLKRPRGHHSVRGFINLGATLAHFPEASNHVLRRHGCDQAGHNAIENPEVGVAGRPAEL